jgi:hypothetical protein
VKPEGEVMTEAEWLACAHPEPMLDFLRGWISDRQLRLFAVACCRRIWPLLTDERSRQAITIAERSADGLADEQELQAAATEARGAIQDGEAEFQTADPRVGILAEWDFSAWDAACAAPTAATHCAQPAFCVHSDHDVTWSCSEAAAWGAIATDPKAWDAAIAAESGAQAALLRDLLGNPF